MFSIVPAPTFECSVNLSRPDADAPVAVRITWRHKGRRELQAWLRDDAKKTGDDAEWLDLVVAAWSGFVDPDGKPVDYSKTALAALLAAFPSAGQELYLAYLARLQDARAKN